MCLLEPKEEVMKLQNFNFWYLPVEGLLHSTSKKSQKVLVTVVFFFSLYRTCIFCCAKPGLWIKTKFGSPAIPWNELLTTKRGGITMQPHGKIISSLYPYRVQTGSENTMYSFDGSFYIYWGKSHKSYPAFLRIQSNSIINTDKFFYSILSILKWRKHCKILR